MLNDEQMREYIKKAQSPDQDIKQAAIEVIMEHNLNLVRSIVTRFVNRGYEWEDLFQIGSIGLLKSIERFDLSMGVKFSTYAVPMIIGEIKRFLRDDSPIKISRSIKELAAQIYKVRESLEKKSGREPTISEIAQELSLPSEEIAAALEAVQPQVSLYQPAYSDNNEKNSEIYILDKIKAHKGELEGEFGDFIDKLALKEVLSKLPDKEKTVIFHRFFADKTQSDIAKLMGLSQVQISRIEKQALKLIRQSLSG